VLVLNLPQNPTGIYFSKDALGRILELAAKQGTFVLNDFVYGEMGFEGSPPSLLSAGKEGDGFSGYAEIYSLSKAYSLAGWRIGALLGDERLIQVFSELKAEIDYGSFLPLQISAAALLESEKDIASDARETYRARMEQVALGLSEMGWQLSKPAAGACVWVRIPEPLGSRLPSLAASASALPALPFSSEAVKAEAPSRSLAFVDDFLECSGIMLLPGSAFGPEFDDFVRISLVQKEEELLRVLRALKKFQTECLNSHRGDGYK
jgi:aspartate/methionine/tyrosine aminotransferase